MNDRQKQLVLDILITNLDIQCDGLNYEMSDSERLERVKCLKEAGEAVVAMFELKTK